MQRLCRTLSLFLILAGGLAAAEPSLEPFAVDWAGPPESPASVSFLLSSPAGKDGFLRVADGHLARPDGSRFRIWGVNITAKATLPANEDAPRVAAHLARYGVNCVRLHFLDSQSPRGLVDSKRDDTRSLDPAMLDRLDFFIAQLKDRGIYTDLNLNVGRIYKAGDGVRDHELLGFAKALTYFDPRLLELQKEYARQLLTHRNPYTKNEYCREPAVALVELVNENSIVESWFSGRLLGRNQRKNPGTWTDITASYEKSLTELYNRWLSEHLTPEALARLRASAGAAQGPMPRLTPAEFAKASKERFQTEAAFYMDLERRYFQDMARYLREELGVKPLVLATSDHNHGKSGYPLVSSTSLLDIVDGHVYWQHPRYLNEAAGRRKGFDIPNSPMVNNPPRSTPVELSRTAVAGKPYTVSEVNHPFPSEYACEGIPILAAYAALQDWDGIFWYTLAHDDVISAGSRPIGHFDLAPDPVKMSQIAAGALMFLRPDVRPASRVVTRSYSREQVIESLRLPGSEAPYFTPGFPRELPLVHGTRISSLDGPPTSSTWESVDTGPIRSDTGQIVWQGAAAKQGLVTVETERSQALVGFCEANKAATRNMAAQVENGFCALTLSALDDQPIARAGKLLLTACGRVANSNMRWNASRTSLEEWGKAPACIETVNGAVVLRGLDGATGVSAQPLDGAGHSLGAAVAAVKTADGWSLVLGERPTTWYLLSVVR